MVADMDEHALLAALLAPESPLRTALCERLVDHQLGQPLRHFISEADLEHLVREGARPSAVEGHLHRYILPMVERCLDTMAEHNQPLGVWVDPSLRTRAVQLLTGPNGPRFAYMEGAVSAPVLRALLAPVFQEVLLSFVSRLSSALGVAAPAEDGHFLSRLGREVGDRGKRWAELGRTLVGGLGLHEKLSQLAGDFSQQAVTTFRAHLSTRLRSSEGQALLRQLIDQVLDQALRTPMAEVRADCDRIPLAELLRLHPAGMAHAVAQPLFEVLLRQEAQHFMQEHGERPLRELLADLGLEQQVRDLGVKLVERGTDSFLRSPDFASWLSQWLSTAAATGA